MSSEKKEIFDSIIKKIDHAISLLKTNDENLKATLSAEITSIQEALDYFNNEKNYEFIKDYINHQYKNPESRITALTSAKELLQYHEEQYIKKPDKEVIPEINFDLNPNKAEV